MKSHEAHRGKRLGAWRRFALNAAGFLLLAATASGQPVYKIVMPDGRIVYSDTPPSGPARVPLPGAPRANMGVPSVAPALPLGETFGALRSSREMDEFRNCSRTHASTISLIKASEELVRTVSGIRNAGAGASAHLLEQQARQWKYYKSLGGTAATPEEVRMPEDPCAGAREAVQRKSADFETRYRECAAAHEKEIKLSALSRDLVRDRNFVAALERVQEERRKNPNFDAQNKGGGEWAAAFKADPAPLRVQLTLRFQEYRNAGGPAVRIEEVTEMPNPCTPASPPSKPSAITDRKTLPVPLR